MEKCKTLLATGAAALAAFVSVQSAPAAPAATRCVAVEGGVEYRAYLPDQKRYVYVQVKTLSGFYPSVFVTVDKNYDADKAKIAANDPYYAWWIDRSKPMSFSTDQVAIRWQDESGWSSVTSWISSPDWVTVKQPIRGLEPSGSAFTGTGSSDTNTFAFHTRLELGALSGDTFEAALPTVSYDGVTLSPPVVHFERDGRNVTVHC